MVMRSFLLGCCGAAVVGCVDLGLEQGDFACSRGGPCDGSAGDALEADGSKDNADGGLDAGAEAGADASLDAGARDSSCNGGPSGTWTQLSPSGAIARSGHTAIADETRSRALIFGGAGSNNDLAALTLGATPAFVVVATSTHPPARREHAAVLAENDDEMLIFGGRSASEALLDDTWILSLIDSTWSQNDPIDSPRESSAAAAEFGAGAILGENELIHGCGSNGPIDEVWIFDTTVYDWDQPTRSDPRPEPRCDHAAVGVPSLGTLIFGGRAAATLDDLWTLQIQGPLNWTRIVATGTPPPARFGHSMVLDVPRRRVLVFGGEGEDGVRRSDLSAFSLDDTCWTDLTPAGAGPSPRVQHAAFMLDGKMYLYGGDDGAARDDLWELSF